MSWWARTGGRSRSRRRRLRHDPEKWQPVFGRDHVLSAALFGGLLGGIELCLGQVRRPPFDGVIVEAGGDRRFDDGEVRRHVEIARRVEAVGADVLHLALDIRRYTVGLAVDR